MTTIKDFPNYSITKDGKIYSHKRKRFIIPSQSDGYYRTIISNDEGKKHYLIHRLVAETFIPNPDNKFQVNHKNKDIKNNRVDNLEWVTDKENKIHAVQTK